MININISATATDFAAWLGAIGTTGLTLFEVYKYKHDKAHIIIKVKTDQSIYTEDINSKLNVTIPDVWSIDIYNDGSKPIKIVQIGGYMKGKKKGGVIISRDSLGPIDSFILMNGDKKSIVLSEKLLNHNTLRAVFVTDALGKNYKKNL